MDSETAFLRQALLLVLLLSVLGSAFRWSNRKLEVAWAFDAYITSDDEATAAKFIRQQYPKDSDIKLDGNGHVFGNLTTYVKISLTAKTSYSLRMACLKWVHIDKDNMTVAFAAGWDSYNLTEEFKSDNLSTEILGVERVQNFIVAASTGINGFRSIVGNIACQGVGLQVLYA